MSQNILTIEASLFGQQGVSTELLKVLQDHLSSLLPEPELVTRNVMDGSLPHFDGNTMASIGEGKAELADTLIEEVKAADYLLLAAPMYNFSVPSQLKSWFDHIARAGVTFQYTDEGPVGLLSDKKVYVVLSFGGKHKDQVTDTQSSFLKTMLGFIGLKDVEFIYAEGLAMGDESKQQSIANAKQQIMALTV
ncbi:NAD(P)H-dependent oxidoreductase [Marinomonas sp. C2222]|uniref:FMN dependent NADH:quinone oxidoreductase n=1 Tax=Marinomonas sargassi TaxID=2984494 RepID=A0ABT2YTL8_9GAMM|nr:NAD(P)H-dependent oxidoreductase [Marinomonas sargassi]MCV2403221.1 NAD(P)H-dependent oxidoreductase [Marinomonas sargassi]